MKAILIDDEHLALEILEHRLKQFSTINVIEKYTYFDITKQSMLLSQIDVAFLDIDMPGINGLDLADQMLAINPSIWIIFVTAYNEYAVKAFELNALDYLLKPIEIKRLEKTINRLDQNQTISTIQQPLSINVCHELTFSYDNQKSTVAWRTKKARELFLYLLHHQGNSIHKSTLAELFWESNKTPFAQLYTTIYHIRKCLQAYRDHIQIENKNDQYKLILNNTTVDIIEWEKEIIDLPALSEQSVDNYEEVMEKYIGNYLETYSFTWAESEKFRLEQLWTNYASMLGNWYKNNQNTFDAIRWFKKITEKKPEYESAHFALMQLYHETNKPRSVIEQHERLVSICTEFNIPINQEIKNWYLNWQSKTSPFSI